MSLYDVVLSETDARLLAAMAAGYRRPGPIDELLAHLAQARLVPDRRLPGDRVSMDSTVTYSGLNPTTKRTVQLVYPADADLALRKLSVLSPIGLALLGRRAGVTVDAALAEGRTLALRIIAVAPAREARFPAEVARA